MSQPPVVVLSKSSESLTIGDAVSFPTPTVAIPEEVYGEDVRTSEEYVDAFEPHGTPAG